MYSIYRKQLFSSTTLVNDFLCHYLVQCGACAQGMNGLHSAALRLVASAGDSIDLQLPSTLHTTKATHKYSSTLPIVHNRITYC